MNNDLAVKATIPFTRGRIADLICSGMEGGSYGVASWGQIDSYVDPPEGKPTPEKLAEVFEGGSGWTDKLYKHNQYPLIDGAAVILSVRDSADEEEGKLLRFDIEAVKRGLQLMADKYPKHFADFMNENDDAITGDVFVQCCVLGDVVYG